MRSPQIISHNGKDIYYMDFSGLKEKADIEALIEQSKNHIRKQPESSMLTLTNIEKMYFNNDIRSLFTEFVSGNKKHVKAGGVVGVSGLAKIVYNGIMKITGRDLRSFNTMDEAKEWLVAKN